MCIEIPFSKTFKPMRSTNHLETQEPCWILRIVSRQTYLFSSNLILSKQILLAPSSEVKGSFQTTIPLKFLFA